jgi:transposase-like protein
MARTRRRDPQVEQFWRQTLAAWKRSAQTAAAFAAAHGVSVASLYAWRQELARRDGERHPPAPTFVPVHVVPEPRVEVLLPSGLIVRVPAGAYAAAVAELVAALGGRPC